MTQQIIAILISVIFLTFATAIAIREGKVLTSVSASTYVLEGKKKWWFYFTLLAMGILNLFMGMAGWGVFASFFIIVTGMTLDHAKDVGIEDEVHLAGTIGAIVLTYIGMIVMYGVWFPAIILIGFSGIAYLTNLKNIIWWIEILAVILASEGYYYIHSVS